MEVAQRHQEQLERIKTNVRRSYDYFKPNYDRFNEFVRFVFESSLKEEEITLLATLSRPQLEFNILEAYISRLKGEFSKQEPDILVSADDQNTADPMTIRVVEAHLRHVLSDADNHHTKYQVYTDNLVGGFSTLKVYTDWAKPMSLKQVIKIERAFDPTLCGFDQLARFTHKGDGRFCFELFPMSKEEFEEKFPDVSIETLNFRRDFAGFNWSYLNGNTPILIVADYYEKKIKKTKIVEYKEGKHTKVVTAAKYRKMIAEWSDITVPPAIIAERTADIETIVRYRLIENTVIEYEETDYTYLPLIFVDGNSVMVKTPKNGNVRQVTRPYVYHAKGAQRLKNYAGIALANEIENMVQHKFIIKKEALPKEEEFLQAIKDIQKPSNIVVNAFYEEDPSMIIPEPIREINKIPAPPEVLQAFSTSDGLIQQILGSYDASLGINDNQLSGIAIVEAATQSNAAAMPYIVGFLDGYQRAAQLYVDLLPKYYTTPRTLPIMDKDGHRDFIMLNPDDGQPGLKLDYDENALNVSLKAGASFQVQKSRTIMMVKEMMGMSPLFQQFIGEKGINFLLDNMEGRGIEQLKEEVDSWVKEMQQQKQMAMQQQQQQMQNNPLVMKNQIEMQRLQQDAQKSQQQYAVDMAKIQIEQQKAQDDLRMSQSENAVDVLKAQTERFSKQVQLQLAQKQHRLAAKDQEHRHLKEATETSLKHQEVHHKITQPAKQEGTQHA